MLCACNPLFRVLWTSGRSSSPAEAGDGPASLLCNVGLRMAALLTLKELEKGCGLRRYRYGDRLFPDMQGRLIGKRFDADFFLGGAYEETHGCDYLLANDIDMEPVPGYAAANWERAMAILS